MPSAVIEPAIPDLDGKATVIGYHILLGCSKQGDGWGIRHI